LNDSLRAFHGLSGPDEVELHPALVSLVLERW
jgi:hypothetical protein